MVKDELFWCFFITPFTPSFETPKEIIKGFTLRKAKSDASELGRIFTYLKAINAFHGPKSTFDGSIGNFDIYETLEEGKYRIIVAHEKLSSRDNEFEPWMIATTKEKPQSDMEWINYLDTGWGFWILETPENPDHMTIELLRSAFMMSDCGLVIGAFIGNIGTVEYLIRSNEIYNEYPLKLYYQNDKLRWRVYENPITLSDIYQVEKNYISLLGLDKEKYNFIMRAIEEYENLLSVSRRSSMLLVGLFSILELLLTHDDKNPSASRISWQLQKKIALLNNQFNNKINFAGHFRYPKKVDDEKIIEVLYKKRSMIAHGSQTVLPTQLQFTNNGDDISFLRLLIRKTISFALEHPQLIMDLKEC